MGLRSENAMWLEQLSIHGILLIMRIGSFCSDVWGGTWDLRSRERLKRYCGNVSRGSVTRENFLAYFWWVLNDKESEGNADNLQPLIPPSFFLYALPWVEDRRADSMNMVSVLAYL